MVTTKINGRIDLNELTKDDYAIEGRLRIDNVPYRGYTGRVMLQTTGTDSFEPLESVFEKNRLDKPYGVFIQDKNSTFRIRAAYLHIDIKGNIAVGAKYGENEDGTPFYINSEPLSFYIIRDDGKLITNQENVSLIFIKKNPGEKVDLESKLVR